MEMRGTPKRTTIIWEKKKKMKIGTLRGSNTVFWHGKVSERTQQKKNYCKRKRKNGERNKDLDEG